MAIPEIETFTGTAGAALAQPPWNDWRSGTQHILFDGLGHGKASSNNQDSVNNWTLDSLNADQKVSIQCASNLVGTGTGYIYLFARITGTYAAGSFYWFWCDGGSDCTLQKTLAGAGSDVSIGTANSTTAIIGDTFELSCVGSTIIVKKNGTPIISATDTAIASGVFAGTGIFDTVAGTVLIDNYLADNVSSGGSSMFGQACF